MISLYDILEASNGQLFGEPAARIFTDFCLDSRQAKEADLYVAMRTDRGDTHQYIREAVERGALGVLCVRPPEFDLEGVSVIIVRDTEAAMMAWAQYILGKLGTQVICVGGSAGKSLTVEAVSRVLATRYTVHKSASHGNGRLDVPLALAGLSPDQHFVVLELGVTRPGELSEMVQIVQPDAGIITRMGHAHLDTFETVDEVVNETRMLMDFLPPTGLAVLNYDDDYYRALKGSTQARVLTIGMERFGADLMAYDVVVDLHKTGFDLRYGRDRYLGRWIPWLGKHLVYPALAALAIGLHYDISPLDDALKALTQLPPMPGYMNPLRGMNDCTIIDDTRTAIPESAIDALDWLKAIKGSQSPDNKSRVLFVMGDMDNLGKYSQTGHRQVGQHAADIADIIITEGTDAALVGRAALDKGMEPSKVAMTYSVQDAVAALKERFVLTANDIVLITGGASARMEMVTQGLLQNEADRGQLPRQDFVWETAMLAQPVRPSWVEVDLDAISGNVRALKNMVGYNVALMAVVKADAYGHGAVSVSRTALLNGAEYLAVGSMYEALELREAGIEAPILVMNYTPVSAVRQAIRQNITLTLYDLDMARAYDRAARELRGKLHVHVKVDTGMGRLGILASEAVALFRHLVNLHQLDLEGIYTHFSSADEDPEYTAGQARTFRDVLKPLRASGFNFAYIHAANSAATLSMKDTHFNMVRVGIAMYGQSPSQKVRVPREFRPALTWKTVVAQVKTLPSGHPVGYGNTYFTSGEERIAVLPIGYADGFRRAPKNWGDVLVHGRRAPIVGRVSMEKTTINVTHIPDVTIGDEVVLLGRQGDEEITADEVAGQLGTISYEVLTTILPRAPRR
jgi:alanine racemase